MLTIKIEKINEKAIFSALGYKKQPIDKNIFDLINETINLCQKKSKPTYTYKLIDIKAYEDFVEILNSDYRFLGKDITKHLKNSDKAAIFCCSLGHQFDITLNYLIKSEPSKAVIFDTCGSILIEQVCEKAEEIILQESNMYKTGYRYSPGYGDLPLKTQEVFENILNLEKTVGVTVSKSFLLSPSKTVTAIMGISNSKTSYHKQDKCKNCNMYDKCNFKNGECKL